LHLYRAQKEAEVTNGVIGGGDTPPEDDAGGGDEVLHVDLIEHDMQDDKEDSLDNITGKRVSPHRTARQDSIPHKSSQTSTNTSVSNNSTSNSNTINQRPEQVGNCVEISSKKHPDLLKYSRTIEKSVGIVKIPDSPPVITLQKGNSSSTSDSLPLPTSGVQRQQNKRAKERERGESASFRSRGNRPSGTRARSQSSGRSDVHAPPPTPPATTVSSPMIRVSSSAGVIGVAVGGTTPTSSPRKGKKEDGWKEVGRR